MDRYRSSRQKEVSRKQEGRVAKEMSGRVEAASGATTHGGGDVRAPGYRIECKYTEKDFYGLKATDLRKLRTIAFKHLEQPIMQVEFLGRDSGLYAIRRATPTGERDLYIYANKSVALPWANLRKDTVFDRQRVFVKFDILENDTWEILPWDIFMEEVHRNAGNQHHQ
jgi:hypothetical protein